MYKHCQSSSTSLCYQGLSFSLYPVMSLFLCCGWEILSRVQTLSVLIHLPLLPGAVFFPLSCDEPFQFSTLVISQCSLCNIQAAVLVIMVGAVLRKSRPCVSLSHDVLLPLYVYPIASYSLCILVPVCPIPSVYQSYYVPLCIPAILCLTPFVY